MAKKTETTTTTDQRKPGSEAFDWASLWDLLAKVGVSVGSGLTMQGIGVAQSIISGEPTELEKMLPQEAQVGLNMFRPFLTKLASTAYDSALGYDKNRDLIAPSEYVGNSTAQLVESESRKERIYQQYKSYVEDSIDRQKADAVRRALRVASGKYKDSKDVKARVAELMANEIDPNLQKSRWRHAFDMAQSTDATGKEQRTPVKTAWRTSEKEAYEDDRNIFNRTQAEMTQYALSELRHSNVITDSEGITRLLRSNKKLDEQYARIDSTKARHSYNKLLEAVDKSGNRDLRTRIEKAVTSGETLNDKVIEGASEEVQNSFKEYRAAEDDLRNRRRELIFNDLRKQKATDIAISEAQDRFADTHIHTGSAKYGVAKGLTAAGLSSLEDANKRVARIYSSALGDVGTDYSGNLTAAGRMHARVLFGTAEKLNAQFMSRKFGYNDTEDVSRIMGSVIRQQRMPLRNASSEKEVKSIQDRIMQETATRAKAYDSLRTVYGKNKSVAELDQHLRAAGLVNLSGDELLRKAQEMERLRVNLGTTDEDLKAYRQIATASLAANGVDDPVLASAVANTMATAVGSGTTVRGLTNAQYAQDIGKVANIGMRRGSTQARALAMALYHHKYGTLDGFDKQFGNVTSDAGIEQMARQLGLGSDVVTSHRRRMSQGRNEFMNEAVARDRQSRVSASVRRISKATGLSTKDIENYLSLTSASEQEKFLKDRGLNDADAVDRQLSHEAARNNMSVRSFMQAAITSRANAQDAARGVSTNSVTFSRNGLEAGTQYLKDRGSKATLAGFTQAVMANQGKKVEDLKDSEKEELQKLFDKLSGKDKAKAKAKAKTEAKAEGEDKAKAESKQPPAPAPAQDQKPHTEQNKNQEAEQATIAFIQAIKNAATVMDGFAALMKKQINPPPRDNTNGKK